MQLTLRQIDPILVRVEKARMLLETASNAIEAKKIADMAAAAKIFAIKQKSEEGRAFAHSVWIDALRLEGGFIDQQPKNVGANGSIVTGNTRVPVKDERPTLASQGISKRESATAQLVNRAAQKAPEIFEAVRSGKAKLGTIRRHFKKQEHKAKVAKVKAAPMKQNVVGPFDLIVADPPWEYEHCEADNREIGNQYPTASLKQIAEHKKHLNAKSDCILFLWATAPKLDEALSIMKAWGFNYRSCAVWDKEKIGMGYWWRIQHELLLVGVIGSPKCTPECERISSVFREPRRKHSQKPECVMAWLERAFPEAVKLEMYQRSTRPGWASYGNET